MGRLSYIKGTGQLAQLYDLEHFFSRGITGEGITAAVLDTGVYPHADLIYPRNHVAGFYDFIFGKKISYDDNGHGTHVSGIITSMAPETDIIALKVLDKNGGGKVSTMIRAMNWILENHERYRIRVVNISVGMPLKDKRHPEYDPLVVKVEQLWMEGLVVIVAAGNEGPEPYTVTSPGISKKVITVGALDPDTSYSGRGPVPVTCVCKPDVVAPAQKIESCANYGKEYVKRSGTSMATPIVTGAISLLLSMRPWLSNKDVKIKIMETSKKVREGKRQGWGTLDLEKLLS